MPFGSGLPRIHPVRLASGKPQLALRAQTIGLLILSFAYRLLYSSTITSRHIPLAWESYLKVYTLAWESTLIINLPWVALCATSTFTRYVRSTSFPLPPPRVRTKVIEAAQCIFLSEALGKADSKNGRCLSKGHFHRVPHEGTIDS